VARRGGDAASVGSRIELRVMRDPSAQQDDHPAEDNPVRVVVGSADGGFLALTFVGGCLGVFAGFVFVVTFSDLLLDLLRDEVDGGVKIALGVFGEKIGTGDGQAHRTDELLLRGALVIEFQGDAGIDGAPVEMVEFFDATDQMIFDRFGEGEVMRAQHQFHRQKMRWLGGKSQTKNLETASTEDKTAVSREETIERA
jgi:hypothetical protein